MTGRSPGVEQPDPITQRDRLIALVLADWHGTRNRISSAPLRYLALDGTDHASRHG
jgi:hypothetical protein